MEIKAEIKNYLTGKNDYASGKEIAQHMNERWGLAITDLEVRECVKQLREEGILIIAGRNGYGLTDNLKEIHKYLSSRWGELTREMKILKTMSQACDYVGSYTIGDFYEHKTN